MTRCRQTARQRLEHAFEVVAREYGVSARDLISEERGKERVSSARVAAMALACAVAVSPAMVAKALRRNWATVRSARERQVELCMRSRAERERFLKLQREVLES